MGERQTNMDAIHARLGPLLWITIVQWIQVGPTSIAVQFPSQAYLFFLHNQQSLGQVSTSLEIIYWSNRSSKYEADVYWPAAVISYASISVLQENYPSYLSALSLSRNIQMILLNIICHAIIASISLVLSSGVFVPYLIGGTGSRTKW